MVHTDRIDYCNSFRSLPIMLRNSELSSNIKRSKLPNISRSKHKIPYRFRPIYSHEKTVEKTEKKPVHANITKDTSDSIIQADFV